jgi:F-type H+-transporting ATPase subunit delta
MSHSRLAERYAKSLMGLALEQNELEPVFADMKFISFVSKSNPEFASILKSPVFSSDNKEKIIESVTRESISKLSSQFIKLLIRKNRESVLPEIADSFLELYNRHKDIHRVKLTTAIAISQELQQVIIDKIKQNTVIKNIELEAVVDDELIGGFKLEIGDQLIDASILRDLNDVKKQFLSNDYIQKIR